MLKNFGISDNLLETVRAVTQQETIMAESKKSATWSVISHKMTDMGHPEEFHVHVHQTRAGCSRPC